MNTRHVRRAAAITLLLGVVGPAHASPLTPTAQETTALKNLASAIPGARVLWVRGERIFEAAAATTFAAQLRTQGSIVETNPRFSPDGSQLLTVRSDGVYLMKSDFTQATKVIAGGNTASWTRDGKSITAVDSTGYKVLQYVLATKSSTTIYDAKQSPYNGQQVKQAAELRNGGRFLLVFRDMPTHVTEIVDLQLKKYISNTEMQRGDCSPAWAPDGSYLITTARTTSRPVLKAGFSVGSSGGSVTASTYFVGLDTTDQFYIHGERVANNGKYVAFGGKIFAGALKSALREIYVWHIGDPDSAAVRISFDTAEDESPDLYIPAGCTSASQCDDSDVCTTDSCSAGKCTHSSISGCCTASSQCDDSNLCTADSCSSNKCKYSSISGCCTSSSQCDDSNVCTTDSCSSNKCTYTSISGCCTSSSQCDDSNLCTTDSCSSNKCKYTSISGCCASNTDCVDSNPCTTDSCDVGSGTCSNSAVSGCCAFDTDCDDTNPCTLDKCSSNTCSHGAVAGCCTSNTDCNDSNPCTTDSCDVGSGKCSTSVVSGCCAFDTDCDDADPCTLDRCETTSHGCQHTPMCGDGPAVDGGLIPDGTTGSGPEAGSSADADGMGADGALALSARPSLVGGCSTGAAGGPGAWQLLLPLGLLLWRRRQARRRGCRTREQRARNPAQALRASVRVSHDPRPHLAGILAYSCPGEVVQVRYTDMLWSGTRHKESGSDQPHWQDCS